MKKLFIFVILILGLAFGAYKMWGQKILNPQQQAGGPPAGFGLPVEAYTVQASPWDVTLAAIGSLNGNEAATVRAEVPGRVEKINFIEGQYVDKGDVLVELDDDLILAELNQAQAAFDLAESNYNRRKELIDIGAIAAQEGDQYLAAMKDAKAALNFANTKLAKTRIRAPFDGMVGLRSISMGDYLKDGDTVVDVVSVNPIKLDFSVPEKYLKDITINQSLTIQVDGVPGKTFEGEIYAIDPSIDPETRNINLKAMIYNNDEVLKPGMFARVNLVLQKRDGVIAVPEQAIVPASPNMFVYKIVDGKAKRTDVAIGDRRGGMVEITSGLSLNDDVVTSITLKIQDGAPVTDLRKMPPPGAKAPPPATSAAPPAAPSPPAVTDESKKQNSTDEEFPDDPFGDDDEKSKEEDNAVEPSQNESTVKQ